MVARKHIIIATAATAFVLLWGSILVSHLGAVFRKSIITHLFEWYHRTLHVALSLDRPLDEDFVRVFNEFVAKCPEVLDRKIADGKWITPTTTLLDALFDYLVHALQKKYPLATFRDLVIQTPQVLAKTGDRGYTLQTPQVLAKSGDRGYTLLHHAFEYNPNALDVISFFVEEFPDAAKRKDRRGHYPLHLACSCNAPLPVIRVLVRANPRAVYGCDCYGNAPLHYACGAGLVCEEAVALLVAFFGESPVASPVASPDAIPYLVARGPDVCFHRNERGDLPLDIAEKRTSNHRAIEFMKNATEAAAEALLKRLCFDGRPPRDVVGHVAAFLDRRLEVAAVKMLLSSGEMALIFQRDDVRTEFRHQMNISE